MRIIRQVSSLAVALVLVAATATAASPKQLPKLYKGAATDYARKGLKSEFPFTENSDYRDIDCNQRLSRIKYRCDVRFGAGDVGFKGGIKVRYIRKAGNRLGYRYALRVVETNFYCISVLDKPREQCQDRIKKKGNGYA